LPAEIADAVAAYIAKAVSEHPSAEISAEEFKQYTLEQVQRENAPELMEVKDVMKPVSELAFAIPGGGDPVFVSELFAAAGKYVNATPEQREQAAAVLIDDIANEMGVDAQDMVGPDGLTVADMGIDAEEEKSIAALAARGPQEGHAAAVTASRDKPMQPSV